MSSLSDSPTLSPSSTPPESPSSFDRALSLSPTQTVQEPSFFVLPDLVSHCPFTLTYHDDGDAITEDSVQWIISNSLHFTQKQVAAMRGLQAGALVAYCYNNCTSERLRVVSDFMHHLFYLDDISDGYLARDAEGLGHCVMNAFEWPHDYRPLRGQQDGIEVQETIPAKLARDYWSRCIRDCAPAVQQRFKSHMQMCFEGLQEQVQLRKDGTVPDFDTYVRMRRETSACRPVFDLIEYSLDMELPDAVMEHPVIVALNDGANDLVTWSNDLFSYNVEQARSDPHNMIDVFMIYDGLNLQQAADRIGELWKQTMDTFIENLAQVPSWGDDIDKDVKLYVNGMQEWIVGSLHWSFMTTRYFGDNGEAVKATRIIELLARKTAKA